MGAGELHPFTPDWCMAPSETLKEWMEENGVRPGTMAAACAGRDKPRYATAKRMVEEVLARQPLTGDHAAVLARGTFIPARFWLAMEHNYRAGLAAGLKDASDD